MAPWRSCRFITLPSTDTNSFESPRALPIFAFESRKHPPRSNSAAAARAWRIVLIHEPLYTTGWKMVERGLRPGLEPVVEAAAVDLVIAGHQHFYERSLPTCAFLPTARVVHVISGGGSGTGLDAVRDHPNFAASASESNFLRVRVSADWLDIRAVGADGHTIDHARRARSADLTCYGEGWPKQVWR